MRQVPEKRRLLGPSALVVLLAEKRKEAVKVCGATCKSISDTETIIFLL
jgi:hypothetical protein